MKEKVQTEKLGVEVLAIRKTDEGAKLILKRGDPDKIEQLKEEIQRQLPHSKTTVKEAKMAVSVRDLDIETTQEEIAQSIAGAISVSIGDITVKNLRSSYGVSQSATVILANEMAEKLISKGRIRVGLVNCRVRKISVLERCYKCWLPGHLARTCKGPDRSKSCFNCGKDGHIALNCADEKFCFSCKSSGHRTGSAVCSNKSVARNMQ